MSQQSSAMKAYVTRYGPEPEPEKEDKEEQVEETPEEEWIVWKANSILVINHGLQKESH